MAEVSSKVKRACDKLCREYERMNEVCTSRSRESHALWMQLYEALEGAGTSDFLHVLSRTPATSTFREVPLLDGIDACTTYEQIVEFLPHVSLKNRLQRRAVWKKLRELAKDKDQLASWMEGLGFI